MGARPYEVVFFDFGGTLGFIEPGAIEIWARALDAHGYHVPADKIVEKSGVRGPEVSRSDIIRAFNRTEAEFQPSFPPPNEDVAFFRRYDAALLRRLGLPPDEAILDTVGRLFEEVGVHLFEDVMPTLRWLRDAGYRLGIISNASHDLPGKVEGLGLGPHFESVTYSYAVGAEKPDPRIFRAALKAMNVQPEQAIHVGDHIEADARGSSQVGMTPMLIDRKGKHAGEEFIILRSLEEIAEHLEA
ncbi:MAG: HAD family hydrolase [Thermoplasmata archaeon]